jgi:cathepsin B
MRVIIVCTLLALAVAAFAQRVDLSSPAVDKDLIAELNKDNAMTWTAGVNDNLIGKTYGDVMRTMLMSRDFFVPNEEIEILPTINATAPTEFDARTKWGACIHPIRNQAQCGSCWAFALAEVLGDRYCITGKDKGVLSPQYLVSCDMTDFGCQGGYLTNSWAFATKTGIPTDACYPYTSGTGIRGACRNTCADGSPLTLFKSSKYYQTGNVENTMNDIAANGPVESGFSVYQDFMQYKTGVYQHRSGGLLGGHAVKIVGWGVSSGTPYWIVANSWGPAWGNQGFFWIKKGSNECGFESQIITGSA